MIKNKTIFIAHGWSDVSLNLQSKALAIELSKDNDVFFLSAKKSSEKIKTIHHRLQVFEWPGKRPTSWKDFWFAVKMFRRYKPDMILSNFAANDIMLLVSWIFGTPVRACYYHTLVQQHIADFGGLDIKQRINIWRKSLVFRLATHMLPSTKAAKNDLLKYYKVKDERAFVFPNSLPDNELRNNNGTQVIGYLGRLNKSKGVDILIEAFRIVCEKIPDAKLVITGSGSELPNLKLLAEKYSLKDRLSFNGAVSYSEILYFLSSISFLVVPSRIDNLPTVALEALSVATPVIGSDAGGIPDIISHGYNGLLFENGNSKDLSEKMIMLLENRPIHNEMSVNARSSFEKNFCMTQHRERFEQLIESTI